MAARIGVALALAATATLAGGPANAHDIHRGGFERPEVTPGTFATFWAGQRMGRWTVVSGSVDLVHAGFWQAAEGVQSVDLSGHDAGSVARPFRLHGLPLLSRYRLTYALAGNPQGGPAVKTGLVLVNGTVVDEFAFDTTGRGEGDMGFVRRAVVFSAEGHQATVRFVSTTPGAYGPVLDDVRVRGCLLVLCSS